MLYLNDAIDDPRFERSYGLICRRRKRRASAQTESCAVARTDHHITIDCAASEFAAIVRTRIFDRVERAMNIEHRNERRIDFKLCVVAIGDRRLRGNVQPGHIMPVCNRAASDIIV